jgi:hypothetical protein
MASPSRDSRWLLWLALLGAGFLVGRCPAQRDFAELQRASDSLTIIVDSVVGVADSLMAAPPDTVLVQRVIHAAAAADTATTATDTAVAAIPDSAIRAAVAEAVATERAAHANVLASTIAFWKAEVARRDSAYTLLRAAFTVERALRLRWEAAKTNDTFFNCVGGASATLGVHGRAAVGVGVTCGVEIF